MKSYIVRIYRSEKGRSRELLGTVERPGEGVKLAFTSFDELKDILARAPEKTRSPKGESGKRGGTRIRGPWKQ